jgi:serine/threonine protein phosphatase PrpC
MKAGSVEVKAFGATAPGASLARHKRRRNQDDYVICQGHRFVLAAVMDGHGPTGDSVAKRIRTQLSDFASEQKEVGDWREALRDLFQQLQLHLADCKTSGSTLSLAVVHDQGAILAHVGDSEVLDLTTRRMVTADHSSTSLEEFERISTLHSDVRFVYDHGQPKFPHDVFRKGVRQPAPPDLPCCTVRGELPTYVLFPDGHMLAMTRGLGDAAAAEKGLSHEPDFVHFPREGYLLMASDGIWDAVKPEEVTVPEDLSQESTDQAFRTMQALAETRFPPRPHFPGNADDCTVLFLQWGAGKA